MRLSRLVAALSLVLAMTGSARAGLVLVENAPGHVTFDVSLDGASAPGLAEYALLVHLTLPGASFDTPSGSAPGPFTVLTNNTTNVTVTISPADSSSYVFTSTTNFTANLVNGATADTLDLILSDLSGTYVAGHMGIARVTFSNFTLPGVLSSSIDATPENLQLNDQDNTPIPTYDSIQSSLMESPPLREVLQVNAVPEPATIGSCLVAALGLALLRRGRRA